MISYEIPTISDALLCWSCTTPLAPWWEEHTQLCPNCHTLTHCEDGIWRSLAPDELLTFERFTTEYEFVRAAEGRGSRSSDYYLALPYKDLSGRMTAQWKIRARTFDYIQRHLLPRQPQRVLDLGAGNGWLSHRLSLLGHSCVAVDLLINQADGLGAASHFPTRFPRVQADLDRLPFAHDSFDLVIFNASFHYSKDFLHTTAEALRCLRPGGTILIADTPWYREEASGCKMVEEKHAHFRQAYGFSSDSVASKEFLTPERLEELARVLHLQWKVFKPFYGLHWALRPLRAKLKRRRAPSHFRIFAAEKRA